MKAKQLLLVLAAGVLTLASCDNSAKMSATSTTLKTDTDSVNYYFGYIIGQQLTQMQLPETNMEAIVAGINSAMQKKEIGVDPMQMQMFMANYFRTLSTKKGEENAKKGKEFLAENAKKEGVKTMENGIQYKVLTEGTGAKPAATDKVKVHYKGTHIDGTTFDSSIDRGVPAEFPLNAVIPGWTMAIQEMPIGSKWIIYIPSELGYGEQGQGNSIQPNETLIFEVELLEAAPSDAASIGNE